MEMQPQESLPELPAPHAQGGASSAARVASTSGGHHPSPATHAAAYDPRRSDRSRPTWTAWDDDEDDDEDDDDAAGEDSRRASARTRRGWHVGWSQIRAISLAILAIPLVVAGPRWKRREHPSSHAPLSVEERNRQRQGEVQAVMLALLGVLILCTGVADALLHVWHDVGVFAACLLLLSGAVVLNRRGAIEVAGVVTSLVIAGGIVGSIVASYGALGGLALGALPGLDVLVFVTLYATAVLRRSLAVTVALAIIVTVIILVLVSPYAHDVLVEEAQYGVIHAGMSAAERNHAIAVDLLFRPLVLQIYALLLGLVWASSILLTLRAAERETLRRVAHVRDEEAFAAVLADVGEALRQGKAWSVNPDDFREPMRTQARLLANHVASMQRTRSEARLGQLAQRAWQEAQMHWSVLNEHVRAHRRNLGVLFGDTPLAGDVKTGDLLADRALQQLVSYERALQDEDDAFADAVRTTFDHIFAGELSVRVPDEFQGNRHWYVMHMINVLLDAVESRALP